MIAVLHAACCILQAPRLLTDATYHLYTAHCPANLGYTCHIPSHIPQHAICILLTALPACRSARRLTYSARTESLHSRHHSSFRKRKGEVDRSTCSCSRSLAIFIVIIILLSRKATPERERWIFARVATVPGGGHENLFLSRVTDVSFHA